MLASRWIVSWLKLKYTGWRSWVEKASSYAFRVALRASAFVCSMEGTVDVAWIAYFSWPWRWELLLYSMTERRTTRGPGRAYFQIFNRSWGSRVVGGAEYGSLPCCRISERGKAVLFWVTGMQHARVLQLFDCYAMVFDGCNGCCEWVVKCWRRLPSYDFYAVMTDQIFWKFKRIWLLKFWIFIEPWWRH